MQAAFSVLINASSLYALLNDSKTNSINSVDIIGAGVFTIGFLMEVISDYQL
jgi:steroid 5-alpha reductase family enzyme